MSGRMRIFLAGIIQGSLEQAVIHRQDYRSRIKAILRECWPDCEVYCPIENHPNSLSYSEDRAREVFEGHVAMAADSDMLLAYVPEASMGTAVEMWASYRRGVPIVTISPLGENWVVKLLSMRVVSSLEEFESLARSGELREIVEARRSE
jgi:hypothetical protein